MQPDKSRDLKFARWLQVRKELVCLLAEAKATKRKISEKAIRELTPTFCPNQEKAGSDALSSRRQ
jgi:hypothetical protein